MRAQTPRGMALVPADVALMRRFGIEMNRWPEGDPLLGLEEKYRFEYGACCYWLGLARLNKVLTHADMEVVRAHGEKK